ncbi:MAG: DUF3247 family protein [Xanthomonadales bacterium]|nr:DUF3247 family protein [Xanthomonadales bacterium]
MGRSADIIYTRQGDIERLEELVEQLPDSARVRITLHDGHVVTGVVTVRPALQLYKDADEDEGFNGELRLEDPRQPSWGLDIWLSDIGAIERLG